LEFKNFIHFIHPFISIIEPLEARGFYNMVLSFTLRLFYPLFI
jgi:hypothetical protein